MSFLKSFDDATRSSLRALILCVCGLFVGLGIAYLNSHTSPVAYLPPGSVLYTVFGFVMLGWLFRLPKKSFDPGVTYLTFMSTSIIAYAIIDHFFIAAGAGPFAAELFTVPNALANLAFGLLVPALLAGVLGLTYNAAQQSYARVPLTRGLVLLVAIAFPMACLLELDNLVASLVMHLY